MCSESTSERFSFGKRCVYVTCMAKENTYESVCQFVCASEDVGCRKTHTSDYQGVRADVRLRFLNLFFWEIFHYPACFWVNLFMQIHRNPKKKRKKD